MVKKKNNGLGKILSFVALALGVVALCMIFVTVVATPDKTTLGVTVEGIKVSGLKAAFGYSEEDVANLAFSFMALLPWILVLAGVVLSALNTFAKKASKVLDFVAVIAFVAAGVLFFIMPSFLVFAETVPGAILEALEWKLAVGAIVAAICSIVAGALVLAKNLLKK